MGTYQKVPREKLKGGALLARTGILMLRRKGWGDGLGEWKMGVLSYTNDLEAYKLDRTVNKYIGENVEVGHFQRAHEFWSCDEGKGQAGEC